MRSLFSGIHVIVLGKELKLVSDQENFRGGGGKLNVGKETRGKRLHTGSERQCRMGRMGFSLGPGLLKCLFKSYPEYLLAKHVLSLA